MSHEQEAYLSSAEAAAIIGCRIAQVRLLCRAGKLVAKQGAKRARGHDWLVERASAEKWAAREGRGRKRSGVPILSSRPEEEERN